MIRLWIALCIFVVGCSSAPHTPAEVFQVNGQKLEFSPPPADWKRRETKEGNRVTSMIFEVPQGKGHLAATVIDGVKELNQELLNSFATGVQKRDGSIVKQSYVNVAGGKENAYRMEFSLKNGERGIQVHLADKGRLYSIVMTVSGDVFGPSAAIFDQTVRTFRIL